MEVDSEDYFKFYVLKRLTVTLTIIWGFWTYGDIE
jgi:hypothetical protein